MEPNRTPGSSDLSPMEELLVMKVGVLAAVFGLGVVFSVKTWHKILDWAVAHKVLAPAADQPLVRFPAGDGVGLDVGRLVVLVAVVGLLLVFAVSALRSQADRRRRELM